MPKYTTTRRDQWDRGRKAEKYTAKRLKGETTPRSGAGQEKGDIKLEQTLLEVKSTKSKSIKIQYDWLYKITQEANTKGCNPGLVVVFTDDRGQPNRCGKWVMITEDEYLAMRESLGYEST